jgi:hypothetical protein
LSAAQSRPILSQAVVEVACLCHSRGKACLTREDIVRGKRNTGEEKKIGGVNSQDK